MRCFYKNQQALDCRHLLSLVPDDEFPHLTRSTIPLLDYWRNPERTASAVVAGVFGQGEALLGDAHFEYEVAACGGNAPSCTDIMYLSPTTAIAVEGKWREPLYGTVADWLLKGKVPQNRKDVLAHWVNLIEQRTHKVRVDDIPAVEYQMIHRTASACSTERANIAVVFEIFGTASVAADYEAALHRLAETIGAKGSIKIYVHCVPHAATKNHAVLEQAIAGLTGRARADAIRQAMATANLFQFGQGSFIPIAD